MQVTHAPQRGVVSCVAAGVRLPAQLPFHLASPLTVSLNPFPAEKAGYWCARTGQHVRVSVSGPLGSVYWRVLSNQCACSPPTHLLFGDIKHRAGAGVASLARGAGALLKGAEPARGEGLGSQLPTSRPANSRSTAARHRVCCRLCPPAWSSSSGTQNRRLFQPRPAPLKRPASANPLYNPGTTTAPTSPGLVTALRTRSAAPCCPSSPGPRSQPACC